MLLGAVAEGVLGARLEGADDGGVVGDDCLGGMLLLQAASMAMSAPTHSRCTLKYIIFPI